MKTKTFLPVAILAVVVASVLAWAFWPKPGVTSKDKLTVASWGGAYQAAQRKAFFEPFQEEFGVEIIETSTPDYGKIYEWQKAGTASADVIDVETYFVYQAGAKGALAPIDAGRLAQFKLMPGYREEFGVASCIYAEVIAWNSERTTAANLGWADFWNTDRYPGARGLRDLPATNLEAALLVDGVLPEKLYPLDVDRAFRKLDELRAKTRIQLWSSGSQPVEWLKDGTVTLSTAWNGRIYDGRKEGLRLDMSFNQATLDGLWWVIPKHSPNKDLAMRFIEFTLRPDRQKALAENIPYGPANSEAWQLLDDSLKENLPNSPSNIHKVIQRDNRWWAEHEAEIADRWRAWKLKLGR